MNKNKSITVGIDIDDTLALSAPMVIDYSNSKWNLKLAVSDYTEDWAGMWGVDYDEVMRRADEYFQSGVLLDYEPLPGAREVLGRLNDKYRLISVSARNDICRPDTISWIGKYYSEVFGEDDLYFTGAWNKVTENSLHHTKGQICKELGVDVLIDDQLKHCLGASEAGINSILFGDYNWNRADVLPSNVKRARNWSEVAELINQFYE